MKKLLLGIVAACAVLGAKFTYTFNPNELFKDIEHLMVNLLNPNTGLMQNLNDIATQGQRFVVVSKCAGLSAEERKTKVFTSKSTGMKMACNDIKSPLKVIDSLLDLLGNKIIGSNDKPGILIFILKLLDNAGVPDIGKVRSVVDDINNVVSNIDRLIKLLENNLVVDNSGQDSN